jgi:membrane protease YdiL (CAAX protease family)
VDAQSATASDLRGPSAAERGKLLGWVGLVTAVTAINYAANYAGGSSKQDTEDALYRYSTAAGAVVIYAVILGVVLAIARERRDLLAWRPPRTGWLRALGLALATLLVAGLVISLVDQFLHGGREQGVVPHHWQAGHTGAYVANWIVVAGVAPFVEETTYRGLGYSTLALQWGVTAAIFASAAAFALSHGLLQALPELAIFGIALAWLRTRVDSVFPGMLVHCAFNSFALASVFF